MEVAKNGKKVVITLESPEEMKMMYQAMMARPRNEKKSEIIVDFIALHLSNLRKTESE